METIVVYIFKSSGLMALFYFAYLLLLRKETFFTSNRWFLLSGLVTSILLPLFFIKKVVFVEAAKVYLNHSTTISSGIKTTLTEIPVEASFDWSLLLWSVYGCLAAYFLIKLAFSFMSLYKLLHKENVIKSDNYKLIDLNQNIAPFSFFNYIVYNSKLYSETELESILLHETIHSKEKHSLDILVSQLVCALFWFNPIVWFYKKAIVQNLEYIADQKATHQLEDKKSYQIALLKVVSHQNCLSITNNFYQSLIKKRIVMLNKNQSHKSNSWKYSLVLPFLIGFIFLFQIETKAQIRQQSKDSISTSVESSSSSFSSIVTKMTTDKDLLELEKIFTTKTEKLIISKVKRNSRREITAIKLVFDTGKTYRTVMERKAKEGITDIKIYVNTDSNNKKEAGFEDVTEVKAVPVEVFDEFGISTIDNVDEKQTYWSMDNMKKDGKEVVLIINGKVKGATEKIKLPMSQKLGEMKALTAAEFENKYNQKADKNKLYYEVETVKIQTVKGSWNEPSKALPFKITKTNDQKTSKVSEADYVLDKITSDAELQNNIKTLKESYNIDLKVSQVKRNGKGEIIAIQLSFDDNKGTKGQTEQIRTVAIRPIFLKVKINSTGKNDIAFYDNYEMKVLPNDDNKERKITLIESLNDDAIIYVDGTLYTKEDLEYLDVNGLESIKILKDKESLKKYKVTNQKEVVVIETNWTTKK
ncbi:M56 family metallopeptidase [Flavobacterium sp.]